jgi:lysophospholipase L1-like esterase
MERRQPAWLSAWRRSLLLRLLAPLVVAFVTFWMMGEPRFMRPWLVLAALVVVASAVCFLMRRVLLARFMLSLAAPIIVVTAIFWTMSRLQFWQSDIEAFEQADRASPPKSGVIVFTGSSSIRKWETLSEDMAPLDVVNRAFGGSQLSQVNYYAPRIVTAYHPRAVVLYCDNDILFPPWKSPEAVLDEFKRFVGIVHAALPETWIYFVSMKPAPWGDWRLMNEANRLIAEYGKTQDRVQLIDVSSSMLDSRGDLRRELYGFDPMHMNASGYALWTSIVKPVLLERFGTK